MTLILDLDERVDCEELRLEIGRSYAYVGSTLVRTHAAAGEDAPVENTMHMLVKLGTRQYLAAGDEGSDELWNDVMRDWFRNQFRKLGNQALIYNKRQKEIEDGRELAFTWLEVDLQNGTLPVRLRMNDVSGIAEDAAVQKSNDWRNGFGESRGALAVNMSLKRRKVVRLLRPLQT